METAERIAHTLANSAHPTLPLVDVVIVNSRGARNNWYLQAYETAMEQCYGHTGVLVVDNNDHALSIGAAWNLAVQHSTAEYVLFLGDDDYLAVDVVAHLAGTLHHLRSKPTGAELVLISSGMTFVDEFGRPIQQEVHYGTAVGHVYLRQHHTGLYLRSFLEGFPFNESLAKHVSTDMQQRVRQRGQLLGKPTMHATTHHFGYAYRQHVGMASGPKLGYK